MDDGTDPELEDLEADASSARFVRWIRQLVAYVGPAPGRTLTARHNLTLADGEALVALLGTPDEVVRRSGGRQVRVRSTTELTWLDLVFQVAQEVGWLTVEGRTVTATEVEDAGDDLDAVFAALLVLLAKCGPVTHWYGGWTNPLVEQVEQALPSVLAGLLDQDRPVWIDDLGGELWAELTVGRDPTYDPDDVALNDLMLDMVQAMVRRSLHVFAELGVVSLEDEEPGWSGGTEGGKVSLTRLGAWLVGHLLLLVEESDPEAPTAPRLTGLPISVLLAEAADLPERQARAELAAWVQEQGEAEAAAELCAALGGADETGRGLAFRALLDIGPAAAPEVEALAGHPELWPYVVVFRVDTLLADPSEMDCADDPVRWVRLVHTVLQVWGSQVAGAVWSTQAAGAPGLRAMLERAWRVPGAATAEVLAAIGAHEPDKLAAKAAQRALHKHRSAG